METRDVLLVDAFSAEPLAGTPVGVVPDATGLEPDQRSRIAAELAPSVTAFASDGGGVTILGDTRDGPPIHVGVALAAACDDFGPRPSDEASIEFRSGNLSVEGTEDGISRIEIEVPDIRAADVAEVDAAGALGIDVAAIRDVAADFPLVRASLGAGVLVVPVNFLEHLSGAQPDLDAVDALLDATAADSIYAFTFDTLDRDRDAHGIEIDGEGTCRPTGRAEACAAAAIARHGALEPDRGTLRFEAGDLDDRPTRLEVTVGESYVVGGPASTAVEGTVMVPAAAGGDDIIEA